MNRNEIREKFKRTSAISNTFLINFFTFNLKSIKVQSKWLYNDIRDLLFDQKSFIECSDSLRQCFTNENKLFISYFQ